MGARGPDERNIENGGRLADEYTGTTDTVTAVNPSGKEVALMSTYEILAILMMFIQIIIEVIALDDTKK